MKANYASCRPGHKTQTAFMNATFGASLNRIFLPSEPAGTPKPFETTKMSLAAGNDERECLNQEVRAAQVLFMHYGQLGTHRQC